MFVTAIAAVILPVTRVDLCDTFCILASEFGFRAGPVVILAVLALIRTVAAVVVVVTHPGLK